MSGTASTLRRYWVELGWAAFAAINFAAMLFVGEWDADKLPPIQRLVGERSRLELEEAKLVSAERLQQLADMQKFVDPASDRTVYLPRNDSSLALNRR